MTSYTETKMYGMTEAEIRRQYMESVTYQLSGQEMVVMGILSDCQELLAMGAGPRAVERVRQQMNVAKFILSEMHDKRVGSLYSLEVA